jgi:Ca2+-binding EF-hand superfamily protein
MVANDEATESTVPRAADRPFLSIDSNQQENLSNEVWLSIRNEATRQAKGQVTDATATYLEMTSPYKPVAATGDAVVGETGVPPAAATGDAVVGKTGVPPAAPQPTTARADSEFEYIQRNFKAFDTDNDEFVNEKEVEAYINKNGDKLTETEKTALTKFKNNIGNLEELHNDETGDENDGVTRADLEEGEKRMKAFEFAEKNFTAIDADKDGYLTKTELTKFGQAQKGINPADHNKIKYLAGNVSDLEEESNDEWGDENCGITRSDLLEARKSNGSEGFRTRTDNEDRLGLPSYEAPKMVAGGVVLTDSFSAEAQNIFKKVDTDGDGFASKKEVAAAVQSDAFRGKEAQAVGGLYRGFDGLQSFSNDELGTEDDGVTINDLKAFDQIQKEDAVFSKGKNQAETWLKENDRFKEINANGDEFLSLKEIKAALEKPNLSEADKTNLQFLQANYSVLEDLNNDETGFENDGITMKDMAKTSNETVLQVFCGTVYTYNAQVGGTRELYANKQDHLKSITPESVKQGNIGNCYFESAIASVAATQPELIHEIIKDNKDGTYTVTFPGDKSQPMTVDAPTEVEMGLYNRGNENGVWANVLEKAYGKYCQENFSQRGLLNISGGNTVTEGAEGGELNFGRAMSLLTGKSRTNTAIEAGNEAAIKQQLVDALGSNQKRPVLTAVHGDGTTQNTADGYFRGHAYSVIAFDANGADGGTVTIRNPWGDGTDSTRGTKNISFKQYMANFNELVVTEK